MPNVKSAQYMFFWCGARSENLIIKGIKHDTFPNLTDTNGMFFSTGFDAKTIDIDLTELNMSKVTSAALMFQQVGPTMATKINLGDLSKWDTSNLESTYCMFNGFGNRVKELTIGDISNWNTSKLTNANIMFSAAFKNSDIIELDLSGWNFSNVENMNSFIKGTRASVIKLPKNINPSANMNNVTSQTWYDATDNYKEYAAGTIPTGFAESHTLVSIRP